MEQEEYEKLQEEIKGIYEDQMTDEQFERFALDWLGEEALAYYISDNLEAETDVDILKDWLKDAKTYLTFRAAEETAGKKRLFLEFEPDFDLQEEDWLDVEDQMVAVVKEKLGDDYEVDNYRMETKIFVSAKRKMPDKKMETKK